ncbi:MAG TPA: DUF1439 domain-containing protein, partial [Alteromonas mediterranea]|nr:DUF1439 domain-containing protein [Alteromonas mediterranea]
MLRLISLAFALTIAGCATLS